MLIHRRRITIIKTSRPAERDINKELQWLGNSLGLFNLRDKDKSCFRVFIELLKAAKADRPLSSDELAERLGITRGTVIHHINKLMESGLVVHHQNRYVLRVENLSSMIEELERDVKRICFELRKAAKEIDERIGL